MKISIITATYNSAATVADTLTSVAQQTHADIEHIIVDGCSVDETLDVVRRFPHVKKVISERDKGIYDAMNKGIRMATGDYIGILNSDDYFPHPEVIAHVCTALQQSNADALYGDIAFIHAKNLQKITRLYSAKNWSPALFVKGYMPPHPSCYIRKSCYDQLGGYKTDYKIASDYELLIRFFYVHQLTCTYLPEVMVHMRPGGISTRNLKSRFTLNQEIVRACAENGLETNMFRVMMKYFNKSREYILPFLKR